MPGGWTRKRGSTWTWYIEDVPDPSTGRPRQVSKGGFRTRKEARDALLEAQAALRSGTFVEPSKRTVRSYLLEEWLPDNQPPRLRPSSYANYTIYTRTHVVPRLGDIELQRLTPSNLSALYRALLTDARRDGQGLAPKTVRNIHAMLHRALRDAVRLGYLVRKVADAVTPPRAAPRRCRSGPQSSCGPSWRTLATIACTPSGCSSPPPACGGPNWPGCAGSTST
jgi:Phage integrase, N-terminal SAM-like domain/Arm DNA-binding domain